MDKLHEHSKVLLLGIASLILGIVFVLLFYGQDLGLNYSLFLPLIAMIGLLLARVFSRPLLREYYAIILAGIFFSSMVFVRASEMLTFFNILGSLLLLLVVVMMFTGKRIRSFALSDYLKVFFLPLRFIRPFFETFSAIVSIKKVSDGNARTKEIIRGSIMASIALLVFASLFSSADAGFEKLLSGIFTLELEEDVMGRIFLGAIVTAFFIGGFGFMFKKLPVSPAPESPAKTRGLGAIETMIVLGSINTLFLTFILLQISYLFGGATHLLAEGLTYAEYAREGFFQLVVVAVLSFAIILFTERQIIKRDGTHLRSFKILSGVLVLQVIVILASAFVRLSLYEYAYGFTEIRLYSHVFMIWLSIVLMLLSVHIWKSRTYAEFSFRIFCMVVIFLFGMNMLNPDAFIAKKNLERYQSTGLLDARYLATLSDDALPYTIELLDDPNEEIRKSFAYGLYWRNNYCSADDCEESRSHSWQSERLGRSKAEALLAPRREVFLENKSFSEDNMNNRVQ